MRPPNATEREKKICVAASNHTRGFFRVCHCHEHNISLGNQLFVGLKIKNFTPTHVRGEEVQQSISSSRQSEGTDQENSQHQVREGRCHIHSLKRYKNIKITYFWGEMINVMTWENSFGRQKPHIVIA